MRPAFITASRLAIDIASSWSCVTIDEGEAELLLQAHQLEARALAQLAVERGQRLVEQQELGPLDQRAGQRHALALAARELRRLARAEPFEPHQGQRLGDARRDLGLGTPSRFSP